jgi:hypothetical protein
VPYVSAIVVQDEMYGQSWSGGGFYAVEETQEFLMAETSSSGTIHNATTLFEERGSCRTGLGLGQRSILGYKIECCVS